MGLVPHIQLTVFCAGHCTLGCSDLLLLLLLLRFLLPLPLYSPHCSPVAFKTPLSHFLSLLINRNCLDLITGGSLSSSAYLLSTFHPYRIDLFILQLSHHIKCEPIESKISSKWEDRANQRRQKQLLGDESREKRKKKILES